MKPCDCCGCAIFEVIGNFLKICANCFTAAKTTLEEKEEIDGNTRQITDTK